MKARGQDSHGQNVSLPMAKLVALKRPAATASDKTTQPVLIRQHLRGDWRSGCGSLSKVDLRFYLERNGDMIYLGILEERVLLYDERIIRKQGHGN